MTLPEEIINQDRALTTQSTLLLQLRWHWTLDESNPERVSLSEYGRRVGVAQRVISAFAHGYLLLEEGRASSAQEAIERAHMSEETQAAAEVVAEAYGISFGQASKYYRQDVRSVREDARQRAEELGTDFWSQLPAAAGVLRDRIAHEQAEGVERRSNHTRAFINADARLILVREKLGTVVTEIRGVQFREEEFNALLDRLEEVGAKLDEISAVIRAETQTGIALVS